MPRLDRAALKEQLLREYAALLEERLPEGPLTLEEIEAVVEELGRQQEARLEVLLIQEQTPPPDNQLACPHCGGAARYKRLVSRDVLTMHGTRRLIRRWHHCDRGGGEPGVRCGRLSHGAGSPGAWWRRPGPLYRSL